MGNKVSKEGPHLNGDSEKNEAAEGPPNTRRLSWEEEVVVEVIEPYSPRGSFEEGSKLIEGGEKKREKNDLEG